MFANTPTLLSLAEWAEITGVDPWAMAQIGDGFGENWKGCDDVMYQRAYQHSDHLSRNDVAQAIADAERMFAQSMGFWPAPYYVAAEEIPYPLNFQWNYGNVMIVADRTTKSVSTRWKRIQQVGLQKEELVEAGVSLTRSDEDDDSIKERFELTTTATVASDVTADEIVIYVTATDRNDDEQALYEIRPTKVTINGDDTVTISGDSWSLVKPDLTQRWKPSTLNVTEDATYITEVDVYRRYIDLSEAGTLIWETDWGCDDPPCSIVAQVACFGKRNGLMGKIVPRPASFDADTSAWQSVNLLRGQAPDRITVSYLAGYPRQANGKMDRTMARIITMLSVSLMAKRKCGCQYANQVIGNWQDYPGTWRKDHWQSAVALSHIQSEWGAKTGAIEAWRLAQNYQIWDGINAG